MNNNQTIDQLEVSDTGEIAYRIATLSENQNGLFTSTYHRSTVIPGQDVSELPQPVQNAAQQAWTPEVLQEWTLKMSSPFT